VFLVFLFFWTIAVFIWISDPQNPASRWGGLAFFFFGCGGLSTLVYDYASNLEWSYLIMALLSSCMYFWGPFSICMFSLYSASYMPRKRIGRILFTWLCSLPAQVSYVAFPALKMFEYVNQTPAERIHDTRMMTWMITPYFIVTVIVLLATWLQEKDIVLREEKSVNCLLIVPAGILLYISSYLMPSLGHVGAWRFNVVLILLVTGLFIFFGIKKSVMGFHVFQENASKKQSQQAVIRSTGVLHHALKNNLLTTHLSLQNAEYHVSKLSEETDTVRKDIAMAMTTCEHTLDILERIQLQFQPIQIKPEKIQISNIVQRAVEHVEATFASRKNLTFKTEFSVDPVLNCDPVHMYEAILNVIMNAAEAVPEEGKGEVIISMFPRRNRLVIQVLDNGCGIDKQESRYVGTPLFTTKRGKNHYGLGLYYVRNVADLHQADFYLRPAKKTGTMAEFCFRSYITEFGGGE